MKKSMIWKMMVLKWNNRKKDKDWFLPVLIFYQNLPLFPKLSLFYTEYIKSFFKIMQSAQKIHKKFVTEFSGNYGFF